MSLNIGRYKLLWYDAIKSIFMGGGSYTISDSVMTPFDDPAGAGRDFGISIDTLSSLGYINSSKAST